MTLAGSLEHDEQTDDHREEGSAFDESGGKDHVRADIAGCFRLTGDGFQCGTTNATNTKTSSNGSKTCSECGNAITKT